MSKYTNKSWAKHKSPARGNRGTVTANKLMNVSERYICIERERLDK